MNHKNQYITLEFDNYLVQLKFEDKTKKHIHKAKYSDNGKLLDECAICGESFRNIDIHYETLEESFIKSAK